MGKAYDSNFLNNRRDMMDKPYMIQQQLIKIRPSFENITSFPESYHTGNIIFSMTNDCLHMQIHKNIQIAVLFDLMIRTSQNEMKQ